MVAVTRGYGEASKPEDFLDGFTAFVRDNINTIAALKLVVQRPRDLTRADLKELRLALDLKGYSEANLRRAWADAKNEDIAASIIGFVRQAALGDPLMPYGDRVKAAMQRVLASRTVDRPAEAVAAGASASRSRRKSWWTARRSTASRSRRTAASRASTRCLTASLKPC